MENKTFLIVLMVAALIVVAGCEPLPANQTENKSSLINFTDINITKNNTVSEPQIDESKATFKIEGIEGELLKIPVKAVDPDGDFLEYAFDKPFNEKGLWQTKIGDEGKKLVKVTVTDGKLSTSEYVLVTVKRANRPPTIECPEKISVNEGETISLDCNVFDVDGDVVLVGYDGWMKTSTYKTTFGDVGEHTVIVRAKDKSGESLKEVLITVKKTNRAPILESIEDLSVPETTKIKIEPKYSDPDGDAVLVEFSKPLNSKGEWATTYGDGGEYEITVTATDGNLKTTQKFTITVEGKNRAPVLKPIKDISVEEGDEITIPVDAFDPDGDDVVISYSGWMESSEYQTTYDDANPNGCSETGCTATYIVTVTASDGVLKQTQDITVKVKDKNRPPKFVFG